MDEPTVEPPPEATLIRTRREAIRPRLSQKKAAEQIALSDSRWRQIENGYETVRAGIQTRVDAPPDTLAQMARVVGVTADELRSVGRDDAATELEDLDKHPAPARSPSGTDGTDPSTTDGPSLEDEAAVIDSSWAVATELVDAVLDGEPNERLREATRRAVFALSGYLIIRILRSGYQTELEPVLARLYSEREALFRRLWDRPGEPEYPWFTMPRSSDDAEPRADAAGIDLEGALGEALGPGVSKVKRGDQQRKKSR